MFVNLVLRKITAMRLFFLAICLLMVIPTYSQTFRKFVLSGMVVNEDTIPVSDVAIINIRTGKTVRTNASGFFETEIAANDSIFVYHIAYKNKIINLDNNAKLIFIEPENQEIMQVDIIDKKIQEQNNLEKTIAEIKQQALLKKLSGFDLKSKQEYFIEEHGTHDNAISQFFGPTAHTSIEKLLGLVFENEQQKELKKLTSHYNLIKKKK